MSQARNRKNKREQWHESKKSASDITVRSIMVLCARKKVDDASESIELQ